MNSDIKYIILLILALSSCQNRKSDLISSETQVFTEPDSLESTHRQKWVKLNSNDCASLTTEVDRSNFVGFYNERVKFYEVSKPKCSVFGTQPQSIIYCFLDGKLNRKTYRLTDNVYQEAIKKLGKFKLIALDRIQSHELRKTELISKVNGNIEVNKKLTKFTLKWQRDSVVYQFEVRDKMIKFSEMSSDYYDKFNAIESMY